MFDVIVRADRLAGKLQREAKKLGLRGFGPVKCRNLVARMFGSADHESLLSDRRGRQFLIRDEREMGGADAVRLRGAQSALLAEEAGLAVEVAVDLVMKLEPAAAAAPDDPEFFIAPGSAVRHTNVSEAIRRVAGRRKIVELSAREISDDKKGAMDRFADALEAAVFPPEPLRDAVCAMLYLADLNWPVADMETYFQIIVPMFLRMASDDLEIDEEDCRAVASFIAATGTRTVGHRLPGADVEFELETFEAFIAIFIGLGVVDQIVDDTAESAEAGRLRGTDIVAAVRELAELGVGFDDMAAYYAVESLTAGPIEDAETLGLEDWREEALEAAAALPRTIHIPAPSACERFGRRAAAKILSRGAPHPFLDPAAEDQWLFDDVALVFADGRRLLSDVLIGAHKAGYGMADLARSAIEAARSAPGGAAGRSRKLAKLARSGRDLPELRMAAIVMGIVPDLGDPPGAFVAAIDRLLLLEAAGVGFDDVVGFRLIGLCDDDDYPPLSWKPSKGGPMPEPKVTRH